MDYAECEVYITPSIKSRPLVTPAHGLPARIDAVEPIFMLLYDPYQAPTTSATQHLRLNPRITY